MDQKFELGSVDAGRPLHNSRLFSRRRNDANGTAAINR